jgi:hydroxypyruvate isomerase
MPKLSANLSTLFTEVPFLERFALAARAGFRGVEFQFPYEHPAEVIGEVIQCHDVSLVLHNLPAGRNPGDRGIACDPSRVTEFRESVDRAIHYAKTLDCPQLNCLAGVAPEGVAPALLRDTLVANLAYAADRLKQAGLRLLTEAINTRDIPGFYLNHSQQALDIITETGSDNLFLQYDIYHMQIMEGDLTPTITRILPMIGHMQLADTPGRNEPGTGEINYDFLLTRIDQLGYEGWIGCEYRPLAGTEAGLGWAERWLSS